MTTSNARWFRARLSDAKLSQRDFARIIGVDPAGVCRMLKGERRMQIPDAIAFARATGVEIEDVLKHAGLLL